MWITAHIIRFINRLPKDTLFSTREVLAFGKRAAVDQCLYRLVKEERIIRLARGIFIRNDFDVNLPSIFIVAAYKAKAFGKQIHSYGMDATESLGLAKCGTTESEYAIYRRRAKYEGYAEHQNLIFATTGCTSAFRIGNTTVQLKSNSPRKMFFGDKAIGLIIRALGYIGQASCTPEIISNTVSTFGREERQQLRRFLHLMPAWMASFYMRT